jgi:hypothetical protein
MISQAEMIAIWEAGEGRHDGDRALIVLGCARPDLEWDALAGLPLGRRDAMLIDLHGDLFGHRLVIGALCPKCGERLVFESSTDELLPDGAPPPIGPVRLISGGYELVARPITTRDLARLGALADPDAARRALVAMAVIEARGPEGPVAADDLPPDVCAALAEALGEADPVADIEFQVDCPACGNAWTITFDIVRYMWRELTIAAQTLLDEVHDIARHLGWTQSEILSLSPVRRAHFLARARA